jgi:PLD-like domain
MSQFDIDDLLEFDPPRYLCKKCFAIDQPPIDQYSEDHPATCSVCGIKYIGTPDYAPWDFDHYLKAEAYTGISFADPMAHAMKLARIARHLRPDTRNRPHLLTLYDLLLAAEQFVHFNTWGINQVFIGMLKVISRRVAVRGIVSNVDRFATDELTGHRWEAPDFRCEVFNGPNAPHTKMIVVDGLIALGGSANLTLESWRSLEHNRNALTVKTNRSEVISDHNYYFSSIWAQRSDIHDDISMDRMRSRRSRR